MAWSNSAIFQQAMLNPIARGVAATTGFPTTYAGLVADAGVKAALFNNTTTPDKTVAVASSAYNTGVWVTANEVVDTLNSNWTATGRALGTKSFAVDTGSSSLCFIAANTAGAGNVTITNAYGCLVFDDTITGGTAVDQGMCYNYFGGAQSQTNGTFCVDSETEILTRRGWLRYDQVLAEDACLTLNAETGLAEWQQVQSVHVFANGPYEVVRMEGPSHSSVTTPDHRWPVVTPGMDGIGWYTTQTLPQDAQLLISESERTDKVADLTATQETADLVWCVQAPNRTWFARRDGTCYFTGNTVIWATVGAVQAVFNITV